MAREFKLRPDDCSPIPRFDGLPREEWGSDEFHGIIGADPRLMREFWAFYRDRPVWFWRHCVKITTKEKKRVPLDISYAPYRRAQVYIVKRLCDQWFRRKYVRTVDLKARQIGRTTLQKAFELWVALFHPWSMEITVADDAPGAKGILEMLRLMHESLPDWMRPNLERSALNIIQFGGFQRRVGGGGKAKIIWAPDPIGRDCRSKFQVETAFNLRAGRKWTPSMLHATEVAYWERRPGEVLLGLVQGVPDAPGTVISLESTARGHGGVFYDEVKKTQQFGSAFELIFIPWYAIDEYAIGHDDPLDRLRLVFRDTDDLEKMRSALETGDLSRFPFEDEEKELIAQVARDQDFGPTIRAEQLAWRRWAIQNKCRNDPMWFHQEYPATVAQAFLASGASVFSPSGILWQRRHCERPPLVQGELEIALEPNGRQQVEFHKATGGRVSIWAHPEEGHEYIVAADYGEGAYEGAEDPLLGRDNTSILVGDRTTREIVAEATGKFPPVEAAEIAVKLAVYYNRAWLVPENNAGYGTPTIELARQIGYERLWMAKVYDQVGNDCGYKYGWNTSPATRPRMFSTARSVLFSRSWKIPSGAVLDELAAMVYRPLPSGRSKEEAKPGEHDDRACAFAILVRVDYELGEQPKAQEDYVQRGKNNPDWGYWKAVYDEETRRLEGHFVEPLHST